ncbi:phage antirepressor protein, partial [Candidatus Woesearchaeota archaeon]|nr:phage antirepressor protein [Candidatus Woesearchaeota archaeon]
RKRDEVLSKGYGQIVHPLPMETKGGIQNINCTNTAGAFRIIQSIPSPKAEPFKLWLAQVGYERVQEIENPELAQQRMKEIYKAKGYSSEWIEKRMRGIAIRSELTDEWRKRGVVKPSEYAILTAEIAKATFGLLPSEHKSLKNLTTQNLRDHMDDIELILSILGEATTTRFTRERDSQIFPALEQDAQEGGTVAGATRKDIEKRLGKSIVSAENFLQQPERRKRLAKR